MCQRPDCGGVQKEKEVQRAEGGKFVVFQGTLGLTRRRENRNQGRMSTTRVKGKLRRKARKRDREGVIISTN